jgi:tripartite-type tricarboxylate transporter receptor subunit TctC
MRLLAIVAALGSMVGAAAAQEYPTRPINVIVPAAAGFIGFSTGAMERVFRMAR